MSQDHTAPFPPAESYERRVEAQLARLSELLSRDHFAAVAELPYVARLGLEKWCHTEKDRVEDWFAGTASADEQVLELSKILNAGKPDRQACIKWMEDNKGKLTVDQLMQLVSDTRMVAVSDWTRQKSEKKRASTIEKLQKIALRWLVYEAGFVDGIRHSKNTAAPLLIKEFPMTEKTMRESYLGNIETNKNAFPEGVDAARKMLGLLR